MSVSVTDVVLHVLVGGKEALIAVARFALVVPVYWLMTAYKEADSLSAPFPFVFSTFFFLFVIFFLSEVLWFFVLFL